MPDPVSQLAALLEEAGLTARFGLEAQGHLPTIERMIKEGASWEVIGKAIGWDAMTARQHWYWHVESLGASCPTP